MRDGQGRWLPGHSPNPGGRPKGRGLKQEIERALAEKPKGERETRPERIAKILVANEEGDLRALELILKRLWPEKLEIQGDSEPVVVIRDYSGLSRRDLSPPTINLGPRKQLAEPEGEESVPQVEAGGDRVGFTLEHPRT